MDFGRGLSLAEGRAWFQDYEGTFRRKSHERMRAVPASIEGCEGVLESLALVDDLGGETPAPRDLETALRVVHELAELNPPVAAVLLPVVAAVCHEYGAAPSGSVAALATATATGEGLAAWFLAAFGRWPAAARLAVRAREGTERLGEAGVSPAPLATPPFSHGIVTPADGAGTREVALFFRRGDGALDALSLSLDDRVGVLGAQVVFEAGAGVEEELRERGVVAPADVAFCRALVEDAFVRDDATGKPPPGRLLLYEPYLGPEPLAPRGRAPDLGAYLVETVVRSPRLVEGSEALLEHELYGGLWSASDEAYDFVLARRRRRKRGRRPARGAVTDEFLASLGLRDKNLLVGRLATNLEVEARAGRARQRRNKLALLTYVALAEDVVPFAEIPFVRGLAERALDAVTENVERGFTSQTEADEELLARLEAQLSGDLGWRSAAAVRDGVTSPLRVLTQSVSLGYPGESSPCSRTTRSG